MHVKLHRYRRMDDSLDLMTKQLMPESTITLNRFAPPFLEKLVHSETFGQVSLDVDIWRHRRFVVGREFEFLLNDILRA